MTQQPPKNPPKPIERPDTKNIGGNDSLYIMAKINEALQGAANFHATVIDKSKFAKLLSDIGSIPFAERGVVARNIGSVIEQNPRLLTDNSVFVAVIQIMKNIPESATEFQETAGKIMLKLREALIKNKNALNLYHKPMAEYSQTIRTFLALIPAKPKSAFLGSFDQHILNFIMGKISDAQQAEKNAERDARIASQNSKDPAADDTEDDEGHATNKMQRLIKMMFSDVMRLEPNLVSAVILSLVTQIPHGSMIIDDKKIRKDLMQHMDIF